MSADYQIIERLFQTILSRKGQDAQSSYVAKLFEKGRGKIAQKIGEEGVETALAAKGGDRGEITSESADLLFHLMVLWADAGLEPADILAELERREGTSGIEEKKNRKG